MFKKVAFTMYPIADVARARRFYEETLIHSLVCRMAVCLDSEGNSILLHQLEPKAK